MMGVGQQDGGWAAGCWLGFDMQEDWVQGLPPHPRLPPTASLAPARRCPMAHWWVQEIFADGAVDARGYGTGALGASQSLMGHW